MEQCNKEKGKERAKKGLYKKRLVNSQWIYQLMEPNLRHPTKTVRSDQRVDAQANRPATL